MKVVVGLGNPGPRYERSRHNLGFMVTDRLRSEIGAEPVSCAAPARLWRGRVETAAGPEAVVLVQPLTYMNRSGEALLALKREPSPIEPEPRDLLIVHDDVYLPFGRLRLKGSGSDGGHNGLRSILESFQTEDVPRLRCGIGPQPEERDLESFVLETFSAAESGLLPEVIDRCAQAAQVYLEEGLAKAMNLFNRALEGAEE